MVKTSSDDASSSSRKRFKNFNHNGVASWSDVNQDLLFLIVMKLGFVDFLAFGRVCKSWRSLAVSYKNTFMASKPPMEISIYISTVAAYRTLKEQSSKP
ncbi:unnamed protein product [Lactuca virosa]|uniref:F-box domain-containing protein n=1 Tax=Lactuca virosa TaxID=75947 RepID=A0AAU9LY88_9ASTR|nr:unnamed protein product [Lactuca virosa]